VRAEPEERVRMLQRRHAGSAQVAQVKTTWAITPVTELPYVA
jgi:hypothetical protein